MMDKKNILLGLIEKKNLNKDDRELLQSLLNDEELKSFYNTYITAAKAISPPIHIVTDDLRDYILIKNNLEPENKNIYSKQAVIEDHLRKCAECTGEFAYLNSELHEIETHVGKEFKTGRDSVFTPFLSGKFIWVRNVISVVALAGFLYLIAFMMSEFTTPAAYKFASEPVEENHVTRGRTTVEFLRSAAALESGNYTGAISYLERDISENPDDATIFYSHYILGVTYLKAASSDIAGLFPSYDTSMVNKGILNLKKSLDKNSSGRFQNITGDIYYHLGRAYLMQNNTDTASKYFSLVIETRGSKMEESRKILRELGK